MPYEPPEVVVALITLLVDSAIVRHSNTEETFVECLVCGDWEGHTDDCPVPALERWMNS